MRITWVLENYFVKGKPISFVDYPYMVDIYIDESQQIVIKKSAQCGGSEFLIADSLYLASKGLTVAYYFPHQTQANDFSHDRIDKAILFSPYIKALVKNIDNVKLKQIGQGSIYIRGTDSPDNVVNVACDCVIIDELDLINQDVLPLIDERLSASQYKLKRIISNPTIPGFGIDKLYSESDQKEWMLKCTSCNQWQTLRFPDNIDFEKKTAICFKCKKEINRLGVGEWVAKYPSRIISGYHINQLINPRVSIEEIIEKSQRKSESEIQTFYNMVLGEARTPAGQQFTESLILKCCDPQYVLPAYTNNVTTAGIDVGKMFHIRISEIENGKRRAVFIGETESENDVVAILKKYKSAYVVIDVAPEARVAKEIAKQLPGKIYLAYFNDNQKDLYQIKKLDFNFIAVVINRTQIMDLVYAEFVECRNILPMNLPKDYIRHLLNISRRIEKDKYGNDKPVWVRVADDHYFLAECYDKVASLIYEEQLKTIQKQPQIKIIKPKITINEF